MDTVWRDLTKEEAALWPKARLGGALLGVAIVTGALTLILLIALLFLVRAIAMDGLDRLGRDLAGGSQPYFLIGLVSASVVIALLVWSLVSFTLILARIRAAQGVIATGAALLCLYGIAAGATTQWLIVSRNEADFATYAMALAPLVPQWLGGAALTIGLIGYLVGGVRPNAYFRRRVAVPEAETT